MSSQVLSLVNARLPDGHVGTLRLLDGRISAVDSAPQAADRIVDVGGDRVYPGLINAHDHLQLNSLDAAATPERFRHVKEWIATVDARRRSDAGFKARIAQPREVRLLLGGLKNLLSGVTTVAHHDPLHPVLERAEFPVRVMRDFGWSHSLYLDGNDAVRRSFKGTAPHLPWMIHAAEGLDAEAREEFSQIEALGCLQDNTLLIHGLALTRAERLRLRDAGAGLIWCPSSNLNLFGVAAEVSELLNGSVALGSDSRLSGSRDLLTELLVARDLGVAPPALERMVGVDAARLLRLDDRGVLRATAAADLLLLPAATPLVGARREDIRAVLTQGSFRYGDADYAERFGAAPCTPVRVDGRRKMLETRLVQRLMLAHADEPGLELPLPQWLAA